MKFRNLKFNSILNKALLPDFPYNSIIIHDYQVKLNTVSFAKSFSYIHNDKICAFRKLERNDKPSWEETCVVVEGAQNVQVIERGEDPRLFNFKKQLWLMVQRFNPEKKDIEITISNLETNQTFNLQSPFGFNGKNWVPYEFESQLFFIYALQPFTVIRAVFEGDVVNLVREKDEPEFRPIWDHDPINSIGWVRGGTPAMQLANKNYFVGFSHSINNNSDIHSHTFGLYLFNPKTFAIQHKKLSKYVKDVLIDPYGLRINDNFCEIDVSIGILDIHDSKSTVINITFESNIWDIIQQYFSSEEIEAIS